MRDISDGVLVGVGCVLCFGSALGGALVALALDQPDVVETERVVEVAPTAPSRMPSAGDLERLGAMFIDAGGSLPEVAPALVIEISGAVCEHDYSAEQIADAYAHDFTMGPDDVAAFVAEVRAVCAG